MPALPADIDAATRPEGVTLDTQSSSGVLALHPNARDGSTPPTRAFWDGGLAASALNGARFGLLNAPRRRLRVEVQGLLWALSDADATPAVTLTDDRLQASGPFLVARAEYDVQRNRTLLEVWG